MTETTPQEVIDSLLLKIKSMGSEIDALMKVIETAQKGWNECSVKVTELTASLAKMKEQRDKLLRASAYAYEYCTDKESIDRLYDAIAAIESPVKDSLTTAATIELPVTVKGEMCPICEGEGKYFSLYSGAVKCKKCHGTGKRPK